MPVVTKDPIAAWREVARTSSLQEASAVPALRALWDRVRADAERMVTGIIRVRALRAEFRMTENSRRMLLKFRDRDNGDLEGLLSLSSKFESLLEQVEGLEHSLQAWEEAACRSWRVVREAERQIDPPPTVRIRR